VDDAEDVQRRGQDRLDEDDRERDCAAAEADCDEGPRAGACERADGPRPPALCSRDMRRRSDGVVVDQLETS
jgi:hypothetical protein